jgi:hypothetical protein
MSYVIQVSILFFLVWRSSRLSFTIFVRVIAVAIGEDKDLDTEELIGIASKPANENLFKIGDFKSLKTLESKFFTTICFGMLLASFSSS